VTLTHIESAEALTVAAASVHSDEMNMNPLIEPVIEI
jgi:hypothetical protein